MIPGADKITLAPVGRVAATAGVEALGDARQQDFQRALAGLVGKSMPAEVLSRLTDGSFLVRVAGTPARMILPSQPTLQAGADIALTLVSLTPRPTFQLTHAPASAAIPAFVDVHPQLEAELYTPSAGMAKAGALQRAVILSGEAGPANGPAAPESASSQATLSATARVISSVLGAAARSEHPQTAIVAALPLLAAPPTDPARLASQLKDAIGASGLFYESHVAEWSAGQRPLAELRREPQMQRGLPAVAANVAEAAPTPVAAAPGSALAPAAADPATAQFINLQLASQEQGRIAWQGQLLPGQQMAWQISRDPPDTRERPAAGGETAEPPWRSTLRLRFAALGDIGATVVLAGDQLHIALEAGSSDIGSVLRARAGELRRALEASGNPPSTLTVSLGAAAGEPGHD
ncbi:MAG: Flagellar hook-length control protein FliK [Massilia sp.]|jgi:hypothetical protein|nr:Flagellar hook-length control protein FliK [Massilia sp.]MDB5952311.1 Flagellar hook-length control protein FliK [Massilia sp.]